MKHLRRLAYAAFVAAFIASVATTALADDPPSRVARLSFTSGEVSMQPGGVNDWAAAVINRPFTTADRLWTDQSSRAELQLGGAAVRMESQTSLTLTNVADNVLQVELDQGTLDLHVARLMDGEIYEVDTPNAAFTVFRPGDYRFDVDSQADATLATVWRGKLAATGQGPEVEIDSHHQAQFSNGQSMFHRMSRAPKYDGFDDWCRVRDAREWRVLSARYVSPDVIGYEDLDGYGTWRELPQYGGPVWFPTVEVGWAPYHSGHWNWVEPWGWTWVDDASWGFAPFHYGRWVSFFGRWGWVPGPARVRPVYAPALVVWAGGNAGGVAWFPLSYGEPYVPYYHVSRNYFETVNVSNTRITNITYVTNTYYNSNNVQITNIHYRNEAVPGAVIMVHNETFVNAQRVDRDRIAIHGTEWRERGVLGGPPVPPSRQSVLGDRDGRGPVTRPIIEHPRVVVVKQAPPPERVPFEARRDAIAGNGGRPLDRDDEERLRKHTDNDARREHGGDANRGNSPEHGRNDADDAHRRDNDPRRGYGVDANRGNSSERGRNDADDAHRRDNDPRRDYGVDSNRGNSPERGRNDADDAHRPAPQDNPAAQHRNDNSDDRGMNKDNGRHGFPASNEPTNSNAGQAANSSSDRGEGPQGNRGAWQHPDRGGNPAQSAPVQANPITSDNEDSRHIVHRPPVAGPARNDAGSYDNSQGRGQRGNNENHNDAAQAQPPADQQNGRPGWGRSNQPEAQPAAQSATQAPAQSPAQPNITSESNAGPRRIVPRPPSGRSPMSEPVSQPQPVSQPAQPSSSAEMSNGHSGRPIMQPPMQQQNNPSPERSVPRPAESNHSNQGFSAPTQQQQQPEAAPARPVDRPAASPMPPQHNDVRTPSAAPRSAQPTLVPTSAPQSGAHGNNRAPSPQPQSHPSSDATSHGDKPQKPSAPPQH